jgi:hypothetical protein
MRTIPQAVTAMTGIELNKSYLNRWTDILLKPMDGH